MVLTRGTRTRALLWGPPVAAAVAVVGVQTVQDPQWDRAVLAIAIAACILTLSVPAPRTAVIATFTFLPVLALLRRLLIPVTGRTSYDPLLLVGPLAACFLLVRVVPASRQAKAWDALAKGMLAIAVLMLVETVNPFGGGLLASLAGLLFLTVPILWFFIGSAIADRKLAQGLLLVVVGLSVAISLYGLRQTVVGLLPWDSAWVNLGGPASLRVYASSIDGSVLRAFGTFSSSGEYATYLAVGLIVTVAMVMHGRLLAVPAIPLLGWALLLDSSRGVIFLLLIGFLLFAMLRIPKRGLAIAMLAVGAVTIIGGAQLAAPVVEPAAIRTGNPLIAHQVSGLLHPLDPGQSTLVSHFWQAFGGVLEGLKNPIGRGTGITTIAADKFGQGSAGGEFDFANAFISLGAVGGALFILVVALAFQRVILLYLRQRDPVTLSVLGVLLVTFGQWLNGGQYAIAPLVWFLIGWVHREWNDYKYKDHLDDPSPAAGLGQWGMPTPAFAGQADSFADSGLGVRQAMGR